MTRCHLVSPGTRIGAVNDWPPPPPSPSDRRRSDGAGYAIALVLWAASVIPLGAAFLALLCDTDGDCTAADTNQRRIGLAIAALIWLASGPAAMAASGRRRFVFASVVPFVLAAPLAPYFVAGP